MMNEAPSETPTTRKSWQLGIRTLLLVLACCAVWAAVIVNEQKLDSLQIRLSNLRHLSSELFIRDGSKLAINQTDPDRWEVYVPSNDLELCLATRDIGTKGLVPPARSVPLPAGQYILSWNTQATDEGIRLCIEQEDMMSPAIPLLEMLESKDWLQPPNSSITLTFVRRTGEISLQFDVKQPVLLSRQRFPVPATGLSQSVTEGPCNGVLVWIHERNRTD